MEIVAEMAKTTAKERGKGPGKTKGRLAGRKRETSKDKDSIHDGGSGLDNEESLRQKIQETEGRTLSDVEASGSGSG